MKRFKIYRKLKNGQTHYYIGNQKDVLEELDCLINKWVRVEKVEE